MMSREVLSAEEVARCAEDGYILMPGFFDAEETDLLRQVSKADKGLSEGALGKEDASGYVTRLALRNELGDDLYSAIVRSERMVGAMEQLLGGEVYHYHHKMTLKEPRVGGAWEWHQDYGYWYDNGCLFPYLASCMIAVDRATKENGCLQVLRGSHHLGRINHGPLPGGQTGADAERVEKALERLELVYCEVEPGTAIFFHCNTLHRSDSNESEHPRWSLICCYNAARNDPYKKHHHPNYEYLEPLPDAQVKEIGRREWEELQAATL